MVETARRSLGTYSHHQTSISHRSFSLWSLLLAAGCCRPSCVHDAYRAVSVHTPPPPSEPCAPSHRRRFDSHQRHCHGTMSRPEFVGRQPADCRRPSWRGGEAVDDQPGAYRPSSPWEGNPPSQARRRPQPRSWRCGDSGNGPHDQGHPPHTVNASTTLPPRLRSGRRRSPSSAAAEALVAAAGGRRQKFSGVSVLGSCRGWSPTAGVHRAATTLTAPPRHQRHSRSRTRRRACHVGGGRGGKASDGGRREAARAGGGAPQLSRPHHPLAPPLERQHPPPPRPRLAEMHTLPSLADGAACRPSPPPVA